MGFRSGRGDQRLWRVGSKGGEGGKFRRSEVGGESWEGAGGERGRWGGERGGAGEGGKGKGIWLKLGGEWKIGVKTARLCTV